MTNRFATKRLLALILLAASAPTSAGYAQGRPVLPAGARAVARSSVCRQGRIAGTPFVRTELFFGAKKPDGGEVSEAEWDVFLDEVVTPEFPDGLTVVALGESATARVGVVRRLPGERYFYLKTLAKENTAKLYVREGLAGPETLLVDPEKMSAGAGRHVSISYFEPS